MLPAPDRPFRAETGSQQISAHTKRTEQTCGRSSKWPDRPHMRRSGGWGMGSGAMRRLNGSLSATVSISDKFFRFSLADAGDTSMDCSITGLCGAFGGGTVLDQRAVSLSCPHPDRDFDRSCRFSPVITLETELIDQHDYDDDHDRDEPAHFKNCILHKIQRVSLQCRPNSIQDPTRTTPTAQAVAKTNATM